MAAVKNRPLGTQAAPVCEDGVLTRDRLMTADCSRAHAVQKCARAGSCGAPRTARTVARRSFVSAEVHGTFSRV